MSTRKHGAPCRQRRADAIGLAIHGARLLGDDERARILQPLQAAFAHLRQGAGNHDDWLQVASAMNVAQAIEHQGVVRGLAGHLHHAELTLQTMHLAEIDALHTAIDLHAFQLSKLSRAEYRRARDYAQAEVLSSGGQAIHAAPAMCAQQQALAL